jgi:hypothetical protein
MTRRVCTIILALLLVFALSPVTGLAATKPQKVIVATDTGTKDAVGINMGTTLQLTATTVPATAVSGGFTWKSDNKSIAKVSATGLVSAFKAGKTVISATSRNGKKTGKITVVVIDPKVPTSITLGYSGSVKLGKGSTLKIGYSLMPKTASSGVKWATSNKTIASVASDGTIKAKKKGTSKITATTSSGKRTATVRVVVPSFDIGIEKTSGQFVGERISWEITPVNNVGVVSYTYVIYKDGVEYYRILTDSNVCNAGLTETGSYYLEATATDESGTQVVRTSGTVDAVYVNPDVSISNVSIVYSQQYTYVRARVGASSGVMPYVIVVKFYNEETCWATQILRYTGNVQFKVNPSIHGQFSIRASITDHSKNTDSDQYDMLI